jgi:hypothetical protein
MDDELLADPVIAGIKDDPIVHTPIMHTYDALCSAHCSSSAYVSSLSK